MFFSIKRWPGCTEEDNMKTVRTVKQLRSTKQSDDGREKGIIGSGEGSIQIPQSTCNTLHGFREKQTPEK